MAEKLKIAFCAEIASILDHPVEEAVEIIGRIQNVGIALRHLRPGRISHP